MECVIMIVEHRFSINQIIWSAIDWRPIAYDKCTLFLCKLHNLHLLYLLEVTNLKVNLKVYLSLITSIRKSNWNFNIQSFYCIFEICLRINIQRREFFSSFYTFLIRHNSYFDNANEMVSSNIYRHRDRLY